MISKMIILAHSRVNSQTGNVRQEFHKTMLESFRKCIQSAHKISYEFYCSFWDAINQIKKMHLNSTR